MSSLKIINEAWSPLFAVLTAIGAMMWVESGADEIAEQRAAAVFIPPEPRTATLTLKQYGEGVGLAALCTVVPTALGYYAINQGMGEYESLAAWAMAAGIIAGPSAGQVYHGFYGHAVAATSVRLLGTTIVFLSALSGLADALGRMDCVPDESPPSRCDDEPSDAEGGIKFGITVYALGVTYSLLQPLWRVRLPQRVGDAKGSSLSDKLGFLPHTLAPVFIPESAGGMKTGLIAGWGF